MIGTRLAHFTITAHLGSGGMGEVYQATDSKLGRSVAIKLLPAAFASDADRLARFRREAQVLASLNHPNIAHIYGLEESGEMRCIVMELVEGETLQARLKNGPIPAAEALALAAQIVEALEAAHEKGVVHRDLKPGNVMLTGDGKVKVLDFGLAKALERSPANTTLSSSPTMSLAATNAGMIMGTAAYMSPEQARGLPVDARSDIFSFGAVLYEMLTGRRAFQGEMVSDILASVLKSDPDFSQLPSKLNPRLRELLRRALDKNLTRRWQAVGDVRFEIEAILADPQGVLVEEQRAANRRPLWKRAIPVLIAALIAGTIGSIGAWNLKPPAPGTVTRFPLLLPEGQSLFASGGRQALAVSPDGTALVYTTNSNLFLRSLSEMEARPLLSDSEVPGISSPFFSPDGQWVGFWSGQDSALKKIAATGGAALTISKADNPSGVSWDGDQIVFGQGNKGIMRVSANGGDPEVLAKVQPLEVADGPQILDGGKALLFSLTTAGAGEGTNRWDKAQIVVQSLSSGERKVVIKGGSAARYLPSGHLVYAIAGTLLAIPFDLGKLQVRGGPVPVVEGVRRSPNPQVQPATAYVVFSRNGSMVYIPGFEGSNRQRLVLMDQTGKAQPLPLPPNVYVSPRISPDGKQLTVATDNGKEGIVWVYDLNGGGSLRRLTFGGRNLFPIWSRDGRYITFQSDREGDRGLFRQLADGSGSAERLTKADQEVFHIPEAWSPDGKTLSFQLVRVRNGGIWTVSLEGEAGSEKPKPFVELPGSSQANSVFSPDGRWLAYSSNELAMAPRVFVQPFPPTGAKYQISTEVSTAPVWSPDGKQLFYHLVGPRMVVVDIRTAPSFNFGPARLLPIEGFLNPVAQVRFYDVTPDGKQFIMVLPDTPQTDPNRRATTQINVVLNWFEELKQHVPAQ